jgi:hypothetical protein
MSVSAMHELPIAFLNACGIPSERVRSCSFHFDINEVPTVEVTYVVFDGEPPAVSESTVKFQQVIE